MLRDNMVYVISNVVIFCVIIAPLCASDHDISEIQLYKKEAIRKENRVKQEFEKEFPDYNILIPEALHTQNIPAQKYTCEYIISNPTDERLVYLPAYFALLTAKEKKELFVDALESSLFVENQDRSRFVFFDITKTGLLCNLPQCIEKMAGVLLEDNSAFQVKLNNLMVMLPESCVGDALKANKSSVEHIVRLQTLTSVWCGDYSDAYKHLEQHQKMIPSFITSIGHLIQGSKEWQRVSRSFFSAFFTQEPWVTLRLSIAKELAKKYESPDSALSQSWSSLSVWLRCVVSHYLVKNQKKALSATESLSLAQDFCTIEVKKLSPDRKKYGNRVAEEIFDRVHTNQENKSRTALYEQFIKAGWELTRVKFFEQLCRKEFTDNDAETLCKLIKEEKNDPTLCMLQVDKYALEYNQNKDPVTFHQMIVGFGQVRQLGAKKLGCQWEQYVTPLAREIFWQEALTCREKPELENMYDFSIMAYAVFLNTDKPIAEKKKLLQTGLFKYPLTSLLYVECLLQEHECMIYMLSWAERDVVYCALHHAIMQNQKSKDAAVDAFDATTHDKALMLLEQAYNFGDLGSAITIASMESDSQKICGYIGTFPFKTVATMLFFNTPCDNYITLAQDFGVLQVIEDGAKKGHPGDQGALFRLYFAKAYDDIMNKKDMTQEELNFVTSILQYSKPYLDSPSRKEEASTEVVKNYVLNLIDQMIKKKINVPTFQKLKSSIKNL